MYIKRLVYYALQILESIDRQQPVDTESNVEEESNQLDSNEVVIVDIDQISEEPDPIVDVRRLFKQIDRQRDQSRELLNLIERDALEEEQLKVLLAFVKMFIFNKVYYQLFDCPTIHFLVVIGIDKENDQLRIDNEYLYYIASLVYYFYVLAL